jgi:hypothetical protein
VMSGMVVLLFRAALAARSVLSRPSIVILISYPY